jgi:hypothetical protein
MPTKDYPPMATGHDQAEAPRYDGLRDEQGPIPTFPVRAVDEHGRLIPLSAEERLARSEAAIRALKAITQITDETDTDEKWSEFYRGIDDNRPVGQKLFEGMGLH